VTHARRFRFAVELHQPFPDRTWADSVREIEAMGYSTLFLPDHFDEGPGPIAGMAAAVAVTSTLNVGSLVLDCDFRHPVVLARELATIDQFSEGRLEVGIGAGWKNLDYTRSGIPMDSPKVRVDRMVEHAAVLKGLFSPEPFSFAGEHYQVSDLVGTPSPFRPGGPPILIGGGAPRVLRFAGATADIVGVNASIHSGEIDAEAALDALPERIDKKMGWVREGAGERFEAIELNAWLSVCEPTASAAESVSTADTVALFFGASAADVVRSPLALIGTVEEMTEELTRRRDRWGYSYTVIPGDKARVMAPLVGQLTGT